MDGVTTWLIRLGARLVVFAAVFWLVSRKDPKVSFKSRWVLPPVALVFAVLDTALYWALQHVLSVATLGVLTFAIPLLANLVLIAITARIFQTRAWFRVQGVFATMWLALALTLAHGLLWVALDYLPHHA